MMATTAEAQIDILTPRTARMVGRRAELEHMRENLFKRGENHYLYYYGDGGLGKTRLLDELQHLVAEANREHGGGFYATGIIDLYHTDTHSAEDLEQTIARALDPEGRHFQSYQGLRKAYDLMQEKYVSATALEKARSDLSDAFVDCCQRMALDARKIVICFDTVELLQYESSAVEQKAGLETVQTRVRVWMLNRLPQLRNVLIVFAGRSRLRASEGVSLHHQQLIRDMQTTFGPRFEAIEMQPLTEEETRAFIHELLPDEDKTLTRLKAELSHYAPIVFRLTGGKPIYLYLVLDLAKGLADEPRKIFEMFSRYESLSDAPPNDSRLTEPRTAIQKEILCAILNETDALGGYLERLALMPKGVDLDILHTSLGLPLPEAQKLMQNLAPLSFIKRFTTLPGVTLTHGDRLFLHDEMYDLMRQSGVVRNLRISEQQVANSLVQGYYTPRIEELEKQIAESTEQERASLRAPLQKLQVERLYYQMASNPKEGHTSYLDLTDQANRERWVGFGMHLLDEFLRFYNAPDRRILFEQSGLTYEQVVRESAQMWVERFYWWGQYDRLIRFARSILDQPQDFCLAKGDDDAILGDICARYTDVQAMLNDYDERVVDEAQKILDRLPSQTTRHPEGVALATARLAMAIGYQYRLGGRLKKAAEYYQIANKAFRRLKGHRDELAMLLNNLAYAYARQGRVSPARPLAQEALTLNQETGSNYTTGLTLSTLCAIEGIQGNYYDAVVYGEEAVEYFHALGDLHGAALAKRSIAYAERKIAKRLIEAERNQDETQRRLDRAARLLSEAIKDAEGAKLRGELSSLYAEQGKVNRELGRLAQRLARLGEPADYFRESARNLEKARDLISGRHDLDRADVLQDLAEALVVEGAHDAAEENLLEVERLVRSTLGSEVDPSIPLDELLDKLSPEYFWPLGKVERLRGDIALKEGHEYEGMQHYARAYMYFNRFSPDAIDKDNLIKVLYQRLRSLPEENQETLIVRINEWVKTQEKHARDLSPFLDALADLTGM